MYPTPIPAGSPGTAETRYAALQAGIVDVIIRQFGPGQEPRNGDLPLRVLEGLITRLRKLQEATSQSVVETQKGRNKVREVLGKLQQQILHLRRYTQHLQGCGAQENPVPCTCGLDALLRSLTELGA